MSIALALARISRPHDAVLGDLPGHDGWVDVAEYPTAATAPGLVVFRFDAPLFFVNAERFTDRVDDVLTGTPERVDWFVLDCEGIGALDTSGVDVLHNLVRSIDRRHISTIGVARANDHVLDRMQRAGLLEPTGALQVSEPSRVARGEPMADAYARRRVDNADGGLQCRVITS